MRIESTTNPRVKEVRRLHRSRERRRVGRTILEGPTLVAASLDAGTVPLVLYTIAGGPPTDEAREAGTEILAVSEAVLNAMSTTAHPQDPVAVVPIPDDDELDDRPVLALVDVSDPGNTGTLIRSATAFGWQVAIVGGVDPWSPKVLRAGMGAHFAGSVVVLDDPGRLFEEPRTTIATVVSGGDPPARMAGLQSAVLFVGNEARGLPEMLVRRCDRAMTIPMDGGFESLNAATAGSLAMYLLRTGDGDERNA
jgi:TrmH family RNA methyltransferase